MGQGWTARAATLAIVLALAGCGSVAVSDRYSVVTGVGPDDMLKLRAGPGTGYRILAGLPEGSRLVNRGCQRVGGTPWCEVRMAGTPLLRGYVSGHYLTPG